MITLYELAQSAYSEGLDTYVEDEADQGIELFLSEVCIDAVDFGFGVADVLAEEGIGGLFCYYTTNISNLFIL